ncbi:MAG: TetR/AcrR family transcriptional regulator [Mycobacterium sp.]|nr:TetR/AcrR family transcriptional regulator [Mycobacterium sp.]
MSTNREPRADAQRNRCRLVDAAAEVFGERGIDAPLDVVAHRAGVGNATLYRHFGNREELIAAVFVDQLREWAQLAMAAARQPDAWKGLRDYVRSVCRIQVRNRALAHLIVSDTAVNDEITELRQTAWRATLRVMRRAQRAGVIREDARPRDVRILLMANAGVVLHSGDQAAATSARLVEIMLAGLEN